VSTQQPRRVEAPDQAPTDTGTDTAGLARALRRYRVLATVVGVLLVVLCLVGLPLHWAHLVDPAWFPVGSTGERIGDAISEYLGVAHGWLYMLFVLFAFALSRKAGWDLGFTLLTLVLGTVPLASFWAEHRATRRVQAQLAGGAVR
jgi:integral membrane protein